MRIDPPSPAALDREIDAVLQSRSVRRKRRRHWPASRLEPFTAALLRMRERGMSQREIVAWLAAKGCEVTQPTVQRYFVRLSQMADELP